MYSLHNAPGGDKAIVRVAPKAMIPGNSYSVEVSKHQGCVIETKDFGGYTFTKVFFPKLEKFGYVVPDQLKGYKK